MSEAQYDHDPNGAATESEVQLGPIVEALIFAAEDSISEKQIADVINDTVGIDATPAAVARAVESLNDGYQDTGRSFRIHVWSGGYRMATISDFAPFVKTLYYQQKVTKLSRSLLETLAILAYKQPATKPEMDYIRGVDCDHSLRKLLELGLVEIAGRADSVGRPLLYQTTAEFMDKFGLASMEDLPTLREIEELMEDPAYSKEHARLLFREGLGLDHESDDDGSDGAKADATTTGAAAGGSANTVDGASVDSNESAAERAPEVETASGNAQAATPRNGATNASDEAVADDAAPNNTAPNNTAPNDTAPNDTAPNDTAPNDTAPNDTARKDAAPDGTGVDEARAGPVDESRVSADAEVVDHLDDGEVEVSPTPGMARLPNPGVIDIEGDGALGTDDEYILGGPDAPDEE